MHLVATDVEESRICTQKGFERNALDVVYGGHAIPEKPP